jgi:hypothetical protein
MAMLIRRICGYGPRKILMLCMSPLFTPEKSACGVQCCNEEFSSLSFTTRSTVSVTLWWWNNLWPLYQMEDLQKTWFQQDNATAHTATASMAYLESVFPGCLISKRLWPPWSPDLSPPHFFLWGHLKDTVYSNHPHTHCKSFRPTFSALWMVYQLAHCKTCSLTWFVVCISVKCVMVDIFSTY